MVRFLTNKKYNQTWQAVYGAVASFVTYLVPVLLVVADMAIAALVQGVYVSSLQGYLLGSLAHGLWRPPLGARLIGFSFYVAYCSLFWGKGAIGYVPLVPVLVGAWYLNSLILRRPLFILLCLTIVVGITQALIVLPFEPSIAIWQVTWRKIMVNMGVCCGLYGLWGSRLKRG